MRGDAYNCAEISKVDRALNFTTMIFTINYVFKIYFHENDNKNAMFRLINCKD